MVGLPKKHGAGKQNFIPPLPSRAKRKTTRREMNDVEKGMIIAFFACLQCITTVAHLVGRPWSTVKNFLVRATERQSLANLPRSGRPEILTKRQRRAILRAVRKDRQLTHEEVRRQHAPNVSLITVRRLLRQHHLRKWLAKKRPKLTEQHAAKRLAWALEYRSFTVDDWEGVIFSDECSVEKSPTGSQAWVFRLPSEKWNRSCILPKKCRKETSLMVWSCFYGKTRGPLVAHPEKSVNANVYLRRSEEHTSELQSRP